MLRITPFLVRVAVKMNSKQQKIISHNQLLEVTRQTSILNCTMSVKYEDFSREFELTAVKYCNSLLSKSLPNCTCNTMKRRKLIKEYDGFGYVLTDSGDYGEASPEDGLALLDLGDSRARPPQQNQTTLSGSPEAKARQVDTVATKYIVAEAFLGIGGCTRKLQFDNVADEQTAATKKIKQLGEGLNGIRKRYRRKYNNNANPIGAAYLVTFCYKHKDEPKGKRSKRARKLKRLKMFLENMLLDADSKPHCDPDLVPLIELAKQRRLFLVVLANENAPNITSNIIMSNQAKNDKNMIYAALVFFAIVFAIFATMTVKNQKSLEDLFEEKHDSLEKNQRRLEKNQRRLEDLFEEKHESLEKNQKRLEDLFKEKHDSLEKLIKYLHFER